MRGWRELGAVQVWGTVIVVALLLVAGAARAAAPRAPSAPSFFLVTAEKDGVLLSQFRFDRTPTADASGDPDGKSKWVDGGRQAYRAAFAYLDHEDPGAHPFVHAFRFFVSGYGAIPVQINDRYMTEIGEPGVEAGTPYPYEKSPAIQPDRSRPGGTVRFFHVRPAPCAFCGELKNRELLRKVVIPVVDPANAQVRWYYQLGGLFVAEHSLYGVVERVIFSGIDPFYEFDVEGVE